MSDSRERTVVEAFRSLSEFALSGHDIAELPGSLVSVCAQLLDETVCGLLLADRHGELHVHAVSQESRSAIDAFELQRGQGPCRDCFGRRERVLVPDLTAATGRWPAFVPAAAALGVRSVHALPLTVNGRPLGVLGVLRAVPGRIVEDDLHLVEALAHAAMVALLAHRAADDQEALTSQLQQALLSRIAIEQAKGLLAATAGLGMDQAFRVLRRYARDHNETLGDVAHALATRHYHPERVLGHVRAAAPQELRASTD